MKLSTAQVRMLRFVRDQTVRTVTHHELNTLSKLESMRLISWEAAMGAYLLTATGMAALDRTLGAPPV